MRRRPRISGLPNRLSSVSGSARLPKRIWVEFPSGSITADAEGPSWRIKGTGSPGMESKFRQVQGNQGHQAGVVGARRHFAEQHLIAPNKATVNYTPNTPYPPRAEVTHSAIRSASAIAASVIA